MTSSSILLHHSCYVYSPTIFIRFRPFSLVFLTTHLTFFRISEINKRQKELNGYKVMHWIPYMHDIKVKLTVYFDIWLRVVKRSQENQDVSVIWTFNSLSGLASSQNTHFDYHHNKHSWPKKKNCSHRETFKVSVAQSQ